MATVTLEVYKGDDDSWTITITDSSGTAIDLTGSTLFFTVKATEADISNDDSNALISKAVTSHTTPTSGITTLEVTHDDTDLDVGTYYFDLKLIDPSGNRTTFIAGEFKVLQNYTRRTS